MSLEDFSIYECPSAVDAFGGIALAFVSPFLRVARGTSDRCSSRVISVRRGKARPLSRVATRG
jgi:hypothetical protein